MWCRANQQRGQVTVEQSAVLIVVFVRANSNDLVFTLASLIRYAFLFYMPIFMGYWSDGEIIVRIRKRIHTIQGKRY